METTDSSLKNVIRAYEAYDEDKRLEADNVRRLEFMTTLVYMNKYLKEGDKILDVAAAHTRCITRRAGWKLPRSILRRPTSRLSGGKPGNRIFRSSRFRMTPAI